MTSARAPRISYSEEQRFYIMYTRIVLCMSWQEIESGYAKLFGQDAVGLRSRGGLTSVYYRIRKRWGLEEVLKAAPETVTDKLAVLRRAEWLPSDFLAKIGELQTQAGLEVSMRLVASERVDEIANTWFLAESRGSPRCVLAFSCVVDVNGYMGRHRPHDATVHKLGKDMVELLVAL